MAVEYNRVNTLRFPSVCLDVMKSSGSKSENITRDKSMNKQSFGRAHAASADVNEAPTLCQQREQLNCCKLFNGGNN